MAKGKTHDKITTSLSPLVVFLFLSLNYYIDKNIGTSITYTIIGISTYLFGGYMFSGDLDLVSSEYKRWGYLKFIWIPYQKLFSHRSIFTHGILLGPFIRILYLYSTLLILCILLNSISIISISMADINAFTLELLKDNKKLFFNIFVGLFLGSGIHTITDVIDTFFKKLKKAKRKRRKNFKKRWSFRRIFGNKKVA